MKRVFVEAFEDESRPQGGHAIILIQGLDAISDRPQFRLKPLDGGFIAGKRSGPKSNMLTPVATRLTESGVELVVGPELVSNPLLLAGTPVIIELPDAGVRGEFLWPNVAPVAPPRRRNVVVTKKPRAGAAAAASPAPETAVAPAAADASDLGLKVLESPEQADPAGPGPVSGIAPATPAREPGAGPHLDWPGSDATHGSLGAPVSPDSSFVLPPRDRAKPDASDPVQWKGRQATNRRRRASWLAPGVGALALLGLVVYALPFRHSGSATTTANARDKSAPAAKPPQSPGQTMTSPAAVRPTSPATDPARKVAALSPSGTSAPGTCTKPDVSTDPLDGGRMRIRITAPCKNDEEVRLSYGGGAFVHRLDSNGTLDLTFDCFAGAATPVEVRFADGRTTSVPVVASDLARVTKVAILWRAPVNLDLHAFEYAALRDERGHVYERVPGMASTALRETETSRRGRGFMSSSDGARSTGDKVEVYTFFHSDDQATGSVDFAIDFETRGDNPAAGTCGTDEQAEIAFKASFLSRGKLIASEDARIAAAECGTPLRHDVRYYRGILPVLKIRK